MKFHVEVDCTPEEARTFLGFPDVSKALGLGQINPSVGKRPPGKLARLGAAQTGKPRQHRLDRDNHRASAVEV